MARPRAADYDAKRETILKKSAELFARAGYDGTSLTDIAKACGTSKALLYHYYANKEALLCDIIRDHLQELVDVVREARAAEGTARDKLEALVRALLEAYRDADHEHVIQINEMGRLPKEAQDELKAMERELVVHAKEAILEVNPALAVRPELVKPVTMSLFGMMNWSFMWFKPSKGMTREQYATMLTTLIAEGSQALTREG
ncbi:MAG: TetR/AcrR family transcriptional regulator [Siculibacillus sp.]|nr:TetR/AcrR family transcriptional regulator [Siculibacillus sp.]